MGSTPMDDSRRSNQRYIRLMGLGLVTVAILTTTSPSVEASSQAATRASAASNPNAAPASQCSQSGQCFADVTPANAFYDFVNRIFGQDLVSGYACGGVGEPCDANSRPYYRPVNNVTRQQMAKFIDNARRLPGIDIEGSSGALTPILVRNDTGDALEAHSTNGYGLLASSQNDPAIYAQTGNAAAVYGVSTGGNNGTGVRGDGPVGVMGTSSSGPGVMGRGATGVWGTSSYTMGVGVAGDSVSGTGVQGTSDGGIGINAYSASNTGVMGQSVSGMGVQANSSSGYGLFASSSTGYAGWFHGNVHVTGSCCSAGAGSFKIDDPFDPAGKYLYQSAVASPDMMDIYNGNVTTDANGEAVVQMPDYFQALNSDYRYQLTTIGQFAQAMVSQEIKNGAFVIKTDKPGVKVSWQVTGIRQDAYANAHRVPVEEAKPASEQGKYLYPAENGLPASTGTDYAVTQTAQQNIETRP